jgi:hypothetical protein
MCKFGIEQERLGRHVGLMNDDNTLTRILLVLANIALVAVLAGVAWLAAWSGPAFCAGALAGVATFFFYARLKLGYWV